MQSNYLATQAQLPREQREQVDYILLDGSGSMIGRKWFDCLAAIQVYVDTLSAELINSHIILHTFDDGHVDTIQRDVNIKQWKSLREEPIGAYWGGTPLYDAITLMGRRLRDMDPPKCSVVIATDGDESDSKFTSLAQARAILDWMRAKGWQVTFIGANIDNSDQARLLGAVPGSAIGVSQRLLSSAATSLAKKRARYARSGDDIEFDESERQQFGGYLGGPANG